MTMSERKHSMQKRTVLKQAQSAIEIDQNKENIVIPRKINIQLFTDNDEGDKKNKRESLGILHESYLKDNDFLTVQESKPKTQHFDSDLSLFSQNRGNSVIFEHSHSNAIQKSLNYDKLYNNEFVINQLKTLLYNHNRQIIWNMIQTVNENFNAEVTRNITFKSELNYRHENVNQDDIAKLHFLHIQTELQTLKLKAVSKELCRKIDNKKKEALYFMHVETAIARRASSPERAKYIERLFEEQLADVGLDAVLVEMKKEINSRRRLKTVIQKIASIKHYISCIYETLHSTISTREQTVACVRKLGPFVEDLTWSTPLTENLCSKETRMFETFPLEYNRRCVFTDGQYNSSFSDPRIYYRDISNSIPTDIELDADSIYMLTSILDNPFSPPEMILLNILKCKIKLDALKSMKNYSMDVNYKKCKSNSLKELQQQESYVQYALDRLNALMYSTTSSKTLATADVIKNVTDIWVQMPLKDFISPKRTVGEKDYKYYEKLYDGPLTKHQSTPIVCPNIADPFSASLAAAASSNVPYSINA
ncbi:hypothetical protein NQ317_001442 [Molorchus minor]|uniref:Uncharacterized protein n=1 Tax=Molorchus minor TaxID=1323400 RepID=A0ABQ9JL83_9CUCU|nr:hypothetical protein NQ317_001442 [Molorchus minor]